MFLSARATPSLSPILNLIGVCVLIVAVVQLLFRSDNAVREVYSWPGLCSLVLENANPSSAGCVGLEHEVLPFANIVHFRLNRTLGKVH